MTGNTASKLYRKPKKKVSQFSKRKVDPAFYWMTVPAAILVGIFLYLPFIQGAMYSFTNSQGYGDYKFKIRVWATPTCSQSSSPS